MNSLSGTAIYLYSAALGGGGSMDIQLDEGVIVRSIAAQSSNIASPSSTLIFWETGLDPSVVHQLTVGLIGGSIVNIDYVNITYPPPSVFPPSIPVGVITCTSFSQVENMLLNRNVLSSFSFATLSISFNSNIHVECHHGVSIVDSIAYPFQPRLVCRRRICSIP